MPRTTGGSSNRCRVGRHPGMFAAALHAQQSPGSSGKPPRAPATRDGRPDFHGDWTNATATMLERPDEYANRAFLTKSEAGTTRRPLSSGWSRPSPKVTS